MSPSSLIALLRLIATAARDRLPLVPILREQGGARGEAVAAALEQGQSVPEALAAIVPADLVRVIASPQLPLAETALLAADLLQSREQEQALWWDTLLHPLVTIGAALLGVVVTAALTGLGPAVPVLLVGIVLVGAGVLAVWRGVPGLTAWIPLVRRIAEHRRLTTRYERLALVVAYRLPQEELERLVGLESTGTAALLAAAVSGAEEARRLAAYHRAAAKRCQRWVAWGIAALIYIGCGTLLVAAALAPLQAADAACARLLDEG